MFIFKDIVGSLSWGIGISFVIIIVVLLFCLLINNKTLQSPIAIIVLGGLFIYNAAIGTLIVGSYYAREYAENICEFIEEMAEVEKNTPPSITSFNELKNQISEEYTGAKPLLDHIDAYDMMSHINAGESVTNYIRYKIDDTIDDHVDNCMAWMLVGTLTGTILAMAVVRKNKYSRKSSDMSIYGFDNNTTSSDYY